MAQAKIRGEQIDTVDVTQFTGVLPTSQGGTGVEINNLTELSSLILPPQGDAIGYVLSTDGQTVAWEDPSTFGTVKSIDVSGGTTGLTTVGGPITQSGTITLDGVLAVEHGGTGLSTIPGETGNLFFNNQNEFQATPNIKYADDSLLLGTGLSDTYLIKGNSSLSSESRGTHIIIKGGSTSLASNRGGHVSIEGGDTSSITGERTAGNVNIIAGVAAASSLSGKIVLSTDNVERLRINSNGTWGLAGENYGEVGQVIVSNGDNSPPTWGIPTVNIVNGILPIENGGTAATTQQVALNNLSGVLVENTVLRSDGENVTLSKVNVSVDVEGILSIENGGTGSTTGLDAFNALLSNQSDNQGKVLSTDGTSILWIPAGGVGTVTSIDVSGGTTGLTTSGGPIEAAGVITLDGILAISHGGTGADNAVTAINNLLPAQTGNSGKYLTTNGTSASWGVAGSSGQLLFNNASAVNGTAQISYNGSNTITLGSSAGNFTLTGRGSQSLGYDGTSVTIVGGASSNTGVVGGEPGHVYVRGGPGGSSQAGAGGDVYLQGGSGVWRSGTVYISTGEILTERLRIIPNGAWGLGGANYGTDGQVLLSKGSGSPPVWGNPSVSVTSGVLPIENGGTGSTTGLDAINALLTDQAENNGKVLSTNGNTVEWIAVGGVGTVTSVDLDPGTTGLTVTGGPIDAAGTFTLGGTLAVEHGGTGATTVSGAQTSLLPAQTGNSGKYLTTNGTSISWGIAGSSGQLLFNSNGSVGGTSSISYDGNSTLSLGALAIGGSSFTIKPVNGSGVLTAPELIIQGGASSNDGQINQGPGHVYIKGGVGAGSSGRCGSVYIDGGAGTGLPGAILFRTGLSSTERFRIAETGAWGLSGANYGTDGQVLMSKGSGLTPVWTDVAGAYTLPTASDTILGGVKIDNATILIDADGIISAVSGAYVLPVASTSTLGGVKVDGTTIVVTEDGIISSLSAVSQSSVYDFGISIPGVIGIGNIYLSAIARTLNLVSGLPGSVARVLVAPTYDINILMKVSKASGITETLGSITFTAGAYVGSFSVTQNYTLESGDMLYMYNTTYDPTFSDLAVTIATIVTL